MNDINEYKDDLECLLTGLSERTFHFAKDVKAKICNITYPNVDNKVEWIDFEISITWDNDFRIIELSIPLEYQDAYEFILGAFYSKLISEEERRDEILNE